MRALAVPTIDPRHVYQTCISSIEDRGLRNRLDLVTDHIVAAAMDYEQKARVDQLYTIPPSNSGNNQISLGGVTKKELKNVYTLQMVKKRKPGRLIYDSLVSAAPLGLCPFCGFGIASTLDHYLPKTKYPQLSVLPLNLVPSCKDCNTGKLAGMSQTQGEQCLHPYFDHSHFVYEQWLFAEVVQSTPVNVRFYVKAPDHWDNTSKERAQSHFDNFKLSDRYKLVAGDELACLKESLSGYRELLGPEGVKQHLAMEASARSRLHKNSWQSALFQTLSENDWYCNGGYT